MPFKNILPGLLIILAIVIPFNLKADTYEWNLPPWLPIPVVPKNNPMSETKIILGRHLFYEKALSSTGQFSCSNCHHQKYAFTDRLINSIGATGEKHSRNSMSLTNIAYNKTLTWASNNIRHLEEQIAIPMFNKNPVELGFSNHEKKILSRLKRNKNYQSLFSIAFPKDETPINITNIKKALASFLRTLISGQSSYDKFVYLDDRSAMNKAAWRGMQLFFSEKLKCSQCHSGFNFSGPVIYKNGPELKSTFHNTGLYNLNNGEYPKTDQGLYKETKRKKDMGKFRTPTLRNIALTAPYMHDGSIANLSDVIDHYKNGGRTVKSGTYKGQGRKNPYKDPLIQGFAITSEEKTDLIEFLKSLTDYNFINNSALSNPN